MSWPDGTAVWSSSKINPTLHHNSASHVGDLLELSRALKLGTEMIREASRHVQIYGTSAAQESC